MEKRHYIRVAGWNDLSKKLRNWDVFLQSMRILGKSVRNKSIQKSRGADSRELGLNDFLIKKLKNVSL